MLIVNTSFIFLLILIHLQNVLTLFCIKNSSLEILRNDFLLNNGSFTLRKLRNKTIYSYEKNAICHVKICIDYSQINGNISIEFGEINNHTGNYIGLEIWFPLIKKYNSILSCIDYICSTGNLCDQIFVEKWIYWLTNRNHEILQNNLINLLTFGNQSGTCDIIGKPILCSSRVCVAEYIENSNNTVLGNGCSEESSLMHIEVYVKIQSIELRSIQYKELLYFCTSHNCNDELTFKHVWKETSSLFNLFKPILNWLRLRNRTNLSSTSTSTNQPKKIESQLNINKYSSRTLFWLFFLFFMILIGITSGFYCFYYKKWQGYIATRTTL
ncbi:unnamed protein product [Adineta steineri]|uniref:Uncharacterized protein n=1 Tax=Adineta steineri TaxID=433720 RepID=A0A818JZM4_9BILA|nr:unnamed protein product [Adineta steineri]CAF3547857.1 unnamed protein product [Adineta steineri]